MYYMFRLSLCSHVLVFDQAAAHCMAGRPAPHDLATEGGVQLSGEDYYLQPKSALVLEAVPHPVQDAAPATGVPPAGPPPAAG